LLFQGISSLFGPHYGAGFAGLGPQPGLGETVVNNYYNSDPGTDPGSAGTAQADYDPGIVQADDQLPDPQDDSASDQDSGGGWDSDGGTTDV
jgi:hypothetical protein